MENVSASSRAHSVSVSWGLAATGTALQGLTKRTLPKLSGHIANNWGQKHGRRLPEGGTNTAFSANL